ncbi:Rv2732c family membrane protein [Mycolicibacter minnesotensis]
MSDFADYRADIEAAERRVAGEIDPGGRGLVVAICVFVLLGSFLLPHTGSVRGWDVLFPSADIDKALLTLPSKLFMWLALVFGVVLSMAALTSRRWTIAWLALAGSAVGSAVGLLAVWSRQTAALGGPGPGIGLILAWITLFVLTFHWARLVWSRTALQLAAEAERRHSTAQLQSTNLLDDLSRPQDPPPGE